MGVALNQMRRDYILDRWVVIAAQRKMRPTDFAKPREPAKQGVCPFCPGNEDMTPPADLVYLKPNEEIVKEKDLDGFRHKDWLIRCFPNRYPAFTPSSEEAKIDGDEYSEAMGAVGRHEILVESPRHDEHLGVARVSQLVYLIEAYQDLYRLYSSEKSVKYVAIFKNHGSEAGASLSHVHSQIIATPIIPPAIRLELEGSRSAWEKQGKCVFCEILEREKTGPRLVWENDLFLVFAPWASVSPFEFWLFPKQHQSTILNLSVDEVHGLASAFRVCFGGLSKLLGNPPYNFGFHMAQDQSYHWHLEVYPQLSTWAGFEKSTGMFINVVSPEEAAASLREAMQKEEKELLKP